MEENGGVLEQVLAQSAMVLLVGGQPKSARKDAGIEGPFVLLAPPGQATLQMLPSL